jgi:DNA polymerase III delta subunit
MPVAEALLTLLASQAGQLLLLRLLDEHGVTDAKVVALLQHLPPPVKPEGYREKKPN